MALTRKPAIEEDIPRWAAFMEAGEYREFRNLTDEWLRGQMNDFEELDGACVRVGPPEAPMQIGLINLAQICDGTPRARWQEVIAEHLGNTTSFGWGPQLSFEQARQMLRVRLYPEGQPLIGVVTRLLAPGLMATVVLDFAKTIRAVTTSEAEGWGCSVDDLFELGLANVRAFERPDFHGSGPDCYAMLSGESFCVSTWLMMLEEYLDPLPEHGVLAIVPMRHAICFEPIVDFSIVEAVPELLERAASIFETGPGSVSPYLYWWKRPGDLKALPMKLEHGKVVYRPDDELMELIASLPPAPGSTMSFRPNRAERRRIRRSRLN